MAESTRGVAPLRLHLNENTGGCSPAVLEAIRSIDRLDAACYPDYETATAACERWLGVPAGWVQLTNGLDEGLHLVAQLARRMADARGVQKPEAIVVEPAFEMYAVCSEAAGVTPRPIPPAPGFRFPIDALLAAINDKTCAIFLTDPNNPTGLGIPSGTIEQVLQAAPNAVVLLDEAYADFSGRTSIGPLLDRHRHLIVGRTFAKGHGIAGLRVGALVGHPETLSPIRRLMPPFSVNAIAARALAAALKDRAYLDAYVAESVKSRELIYSWCRQRELTCWPSEGNFVLIRVGDRVRDVVKHLASHGILIRDRSTAPGCEGCLRITAGLVEHTSACLRAMEDVLAARAR